MEAAARRIGEYQPAFIPGLLQIPAYTRALLDLPGSARSKGADDAQCEAITPVMEAFEMLREAATTGGDAVALIRRVADVLGTADG